MEVPDADSLGFQGSGPVHPCVLPDLEREGHGDEVEGGAQPVPLSSQMAVAAVFSLSLLFILFLSCSVFSSRSIRLCF